MVGVGVTVLWDWQDPLRMSVLAQVKFMEQLPLTATVPWVLFPP